MSREKRAVAVFCGARKGNDPTFVELANQVGRAIAQRGWLLVYGGSSVGLMGEMADAALAAGGEVLGVIPQQLVKQEVGHTGLQRLEIVADMPVRKTRMIDVADGFLVLPGGFGTLDELFEVVTLRQIGMHVKPIVLCDPADYWGPLLVACRALVAAGLADVRDFDTIEQFGSVKEALDRLGQDGMLGRSN
ncbi:MAG: TIGR00730 family Rossman fold protein [Lautropia sp.]|nr:TIGR00730 family Rossman fold protein [Lautropia sp.]